MHYLYHLCIRVTGKLKPIPDFDISKAVRKHLHTNSLIHTIHANCYTSLGLSQPTRSTIFLSPCLLQSTSRKCHAQALSLVFAPPGERVDRHRQTIQNIQYTQDVLKHPWLYFSISRDFCVCIVKSSCKYTHIFDQSNMPWSKSLRSYFPNFDNCINEQNYWGS